MQKGNKLGGKRNGGVGRGCYYKICFNDSSKVTS